RPGTIYPLLRASARNEDCTTSDVVPIEPVTAASRVVDEHVDRDTSRGKVGHDLFGGPGFGQILDHHLHRVAVAAARPLRADAERTGRTSLGAAERVLGQNPNATLEQIAEVAGVARTTVHRRFAGRDELIRTMAIEAWRRMDAAVDAARPHTAHRWRRCTRPA